ncbi:MAG: carboxypeptidase-like regulatory domain-containing protein, partial [Actinomycetota bacterium]
MKRIFRRSFIIPSLSLLILLLFTLQSPAQLTRGAISGTIHDQAGAVIPGAKVKITNPQTNFSRTETTNESGSYRIGALEPGNYTVQVEANGFSKVENREVVVSTASEVTFDVELKTGNISEVIDVTAQSEAITLNKTNGTIGTTIDSRRSEELPLGAARNVNNLALLSPNVFTAPGSSGISANGQRARNNNFTIDGSDNNDITVTIPTTPVIAEAVQEFQIQTNPYSAENGRNTGAAINVGTKSGTNKFHGELWDYYRGSRLNALDNIEKSSGLTRPARFNRNQAGFSIGGPVYFLNFGEGVPAIYKGKDRTFFFYLFQGDITRTGAALGGTIRIPTPAGFAALAGVPLRSGQSTASRQAVLQQLGFLQNIYGLNPQFRNLTNLTANGVAIQTGQTNIGISQPVDAYNHTFRFDHKITNNDNFTVRYI